jgi:Rrf2 family protein
MMATTTIAKWVKTNPSRVRQIVAELVKAGLLESTRGGGGGVMLARSADNISLLDIYQAVGDEELPLFAIEDPFSEWANHCQVHDVLTDLRSRIDHNARASLASIMLSSVFVPWDEAEMAAAQKAAKRSKRKVVAV